MRNEKNIVLNMLQNRKTIPIHSEQKIIKIYLEFLAADYNEKIKDNEENKQRNSKNYSNKNILV